MGTYISLRFCNLNFCTRPTSGQLFSNLLKEKCFLQMNVLIMRLLSHVGDADM